MTRRAVTVAAVLAGLALTGAPVRADHRTLEEGRSGATGEATLDLGLRLGGGGFRLDGRFLGGDRMYGAWLVGRTRPEGFSLDGRFEGDGRALNFRLDADVLEGLPRTAWRWWWGQ